MITDRIYNWAHSQPTAPAIISNDRTLSYADFARAIEATRRFFELQELPEKHTAIVVPKTLDEAWVFVMGLRAQGLDTVCAQSIDQFQAVGLRDVACIVISSAFQQPPKLTGFEGKQLIVVPNAIFSDIYKGTLPAGRKLAGRFGGHILLTSGTTGSYKKVFLDGEREDERNAAQAYAYPLTRNMSYHVANFGLWTATGFRVPSAVWHTGGCVIMDSRRDVLANFFRHKIDLSIITPSMLKELVQSAGVGALHHDCELLIAGGFLPIELAKETVHRVTKKVGIAYGSTELASPVFFSRRGAEEDMYWLTPAPNRIVQVSDDKGIECPPGREGELRIQLLDFDCRSYLDDIEAGTKMFRDGFFWPGDVAVSRANGQIRILGRSADVLNVGGEKVAVGPRELAVQQILNAGDVCLFSGVTNTGEEELVVVIQCDQNIPEDRLDQVRRGFPSFKRVRFELFREFPRTGAGMSKVQRSILRKMVFP
jgi:acyl-CoA synthetase (AMP-forming)/AMP-acid ligase II